MNDFSINLGEAEAIELALKNNALLATDDKNAINACKLLRIPFTSAVGVLLLMKEKNLLSHENAVIKLEALSLYGR